MVNGLFSAIIASCLLATSVITPLQINSASRDAAGAPTDPFESYVPSNSYGQNTGDPAAEFVIRKTKSGSLLYKVVGTPGESSETPDENSENGVVNNDPAETDDPITEETESDAPPSTKMTRLRVKGQPRGIWKKIDKELALGEVELEVINAGEVAAGGIEVYVKLPGNRIRRKKIEGPSELGRKESAIYRSTVDETVNSVARLKFDLECSNCRR
ncbi:MAG: hypothetical protein PHC51_06850 [bacterium]|nr:hypothetical protein [bacterium]